MGIKVLDSKDQTLNYDDYEVGDEFITPMTTITETHVVVFSGLTGDFNLGHTCEHFCNELTGDIGGGTRMAQGALVLSMAMGLFMRMGVGAYMKQAAFMGLDRWRCIGTVMIGDSISATFKVLEKEVIEKRPEWGKIRFGMTVNNHKGELIQVAEHLLAMSRQPQR